LRADLAWIETLLGNWLVSAGRDSEALAARALAERERLSEANPTATRHFGEKLTTVRGSRSHVGPLTLFDHRCP
jgi:hypothetical protein